MNREKNMDSGISSDKENSTTSSEPIIIERVPEALRRLADEIRVSNPNGMTPLEALQKVYEYRSILEGDEHGSGS